MGRAINPYEHGPLVVLVIMCDFHPTMEKLSSLVMCPVMLAWLLMREGALKIPLAIDHQGHVHKS